MQNSKNEKRTAARYYQVVTLRYDNVIENNIIDSALKGSPAQSERENSLKTRLVNTNVRLAK